MRTTLGDLGSRLTFGALVGIALFWCVAIVQVRGAGVGDWLLPTSLVVGIGGALAWRRTAGIDSPPTNMWWWLAAALVTAALVAVVHGAIATPSRHWDGAAAIDNKVFWLTRAPTLQQPFFALDGVFHHSPDYPLLQPLLIAMLERLAPGCGRLVLPGLYLLLLGVFAAALRARATTAWVIPVATAALALTPALLTPAGGAVDSGYCDVLLALTTTVVAAGLLRNSQPMIVLGTLLMIASKPEGLVYSGVLGVAAFAVGAGKTLRFSTMAISGALLLWLPTRAQLLHQPESLWAIALLPLLLGQIAGRFDEWLQRRGPARTLRRSLALGLPLAALLTLPWLANALPHNDGAFAVYLAHADELWRNLANVPAWAIGVVEFGLLRLRFGVALLLPLVACLVARHRQLAFESPALLWFAALGVVSTLLPFLLSPEPDLGHHLRSSLPRLLLHWLGPLWLCGIVGLDRLHSTRS